MTTKIDPIFLIKQKDTNLFLYSFLDENADEEVGEFRELEIDARITSVMGLTDDVFNDEYDAHLLSFSNEEAARSHFKYVKVSPRTVEIVKLNMSVSFEVA